MVTLAAEESFKHADWRDEGKEENNNKKTPRISDTCLIPQNSVSFSTEKSLFLVTFCQKCENKETFIRDRKGMGGTKR